MTPAALWVVLIVCVVALVALQVARSSGPSGMAGTAVAWRSDMDEAAEESAASGRPMMVYFTADWCAPCRTFKREVLSQPRVAAAIESSVVPTFVDFTDPDAATRAYGVKHGVGAIPTILMLDARGNELDRLVGLLGEAAFLGWIDDVAAKAGP